MIEFFRGYKLFKDVVRMVFVSRLVAFPKWVLEENEKIGKFSLRVYLAWIKLVP